jgi:hypothetical protein
MVDLAPKLSRRTAYILSKNATVHTYVEVKIIVTLLFCGSHRGTLISGGLVFVVLLQPQPQLPGVPGKRWRCRYPIVQFENSLLGVNLVKVQLAPRILEVHMNFMTSSYVHKCIHLPHVNKAVSCLATKVHAQIQNFVPRYRTSYPSIYVSETDLRKLT